MTGLLEEHLLQREFLLAQAREPNPEDPAYRDKQLNEEYKRINNPQRQTEQELIGLPDPETEDISKPVNYMERFVMPMKKEPGWKEPGWNETGMPNETVEELLRGLGEEYGQGLEGNPLGPEVYAPQDPPDLVPDSGEWPRNAADFFQGVIEKIPEAAALSGALLWQLFGPRGAFQLSELTPEKTKEVRKLIQDNLA